MEAGASYVKRLSRLYISLSNILWSPTEMLVKARQAVGEDANIGIAVFDTLHESSFMAPPPDMQ